MIILHMPFNCFYSFSMLDSFNLSASFILQGESALVSKNAGDKVFGGTMVVEGSAVMQVTACGDDSTLGKCKGLLFSCTRCGLLLQRSLCPIQTSH